MIPIQPKSCCLIGHDFLDDTSQQLAGLLYQEMEHHITKLHVYHFFCSELGEFQELAVQILEKFKGFYPFVQSYFVLPCRDYWGRRTLAKLAMQYDHIILPRMLKPQYHAAALSQRNWWLLDHCDCMIAYVIEEDDPAGRLLRYAQEHTTMRITNLGHPAEKR